MTSILAIRILMIAFGVGAILDFLMSMLGMAIIFSTNNLLGYTLCVTGAFAILSLKLSALIFYRRRGSFIYLCLYIVLWLTLFVDSYTVLNAVAVHIIGKQSIFEPIKMNWFAAWAQGEMPTRILAAVLIAFLVFAPIIFSVLLKECETEEEKESSLK